MLYLFDVLFGMGALRGGPLGGGPLGEGPLGEGPLGEGPLGEGPLGLKNKNEKESGPITACCGVGPSLSTAGWAYHWLMCGKLFLYYGAVYFPMRGP